MMKKRLFAMLTCALTTIAGANAENHEELSADGQLTEANRLLTEADKEQTEADKEKSTVQLPQWVRNIKFSGYAMLQYQGQDKEGGKENAFNVRLVRAILDGKIGDFDWRIQGQGSLGTGPGTSTMHLIDLYAEWVRYKEFRVKVGQFKRAISFENPTNPITQGWYAYALAINALTGLGDRTGEKSSGGRDIGIQVQGDLFPNASGRRILHYQLGVYNGEGINTKDKDNKKDIIGGLWVMPVKGLRIGAFGWTGTRGQLEMTRLDGTTTTIQSARKNRYAISAEYDKDEYTFRAEYLHSQGLGSQEVMGDKADGWYVFGIVPVIKSKLHAKARYNCYRDSKEWSRAKTMYEVGVNYFFTKNLQINLEYARVNDRTIANKDKHNYNFVDVQLDYRF